MIFGYDMHFLGYLGQILTLMCQSGLMYLMNLLKDAVAVHYSINGHDYTMRYYLVDDIYPKQATFVKTIPAPQGQKYKLFAAAQEACRKDVKRAFRVLQARFAIVHGPARFFHLDTLQKIMKACIILHNMIVEDERDDNEEVDLDYEKIDREDNPHLQVLREQSDGFLSNIERHGRIRDREIHFQLQSDLIEHLWQLQGESQELSFLYVEMHESQELV